MNKQFKNMTKPELHKNLWHLISEKQNTGRDKLAEGKYEGVQIEDKRPVWGSFIYI